MSAGAIFFGLTQSVIGLAILYLVGITIYFIINRSDADKAPSENWPEWYRNIVHPPPEAYSVSSTSNVIPNLTPNSVFTATDPADCVTKRKKGCDDDEDCVGFVFSESSNVCTTLSSVDNLIFDPLVSGNTLYTIEGSEPTKYYATYASNVANATTPASLIPAYIATDYFACSSNCSSNSTCLGFTFNPTSRDCRMHTAIKSDALTPDATMNSYILKGGMSLMSADTETFA